jgi:membrane protein required for colicin V production
MTSFDLVVLGIVGLSTLFAFVRGVIRELIALVALIVGVIAGFTFTPQVAAWVPSVIENEGSRYLIAFVAILIGVLLLGAMIAWPLAKAVRAAGLGFADRFLGSIFGLVRGLLLAVAIVLVAGVTDLPRSAAWQDSLLAAPLVAAALVVAAHLPRDWADALDYSASGRKARRGTLKV